MEERDWTGHKFLAVNFTLIWCELQKMCIFVKTYPALTLLYTKIKKKKKRKSINGISRKMQIQTTGRYAYEVCLQECLKLKGLMIWSIGKVVEHLELSYLLMGIQSVIMTLENSLAASYKGKHTPTLGIYPREMKTYNLYQDLNTAYSSFICNGKKNLKVYQLGNG